MEDTATALIGYGAWYLLLTLILAFYRTGLVLSGQRAANRFTPDGSDLPGLGQRLTRARDNCYENLPMFIAIAVGAWMANRTDVTNPLAPYVLYARVGQTLTHISSTSVPAVFLRFGFYLVQVGILGWWAVQLLGWRA